MECEIARLVAQGFSNREIGATLYRSEHTVAEHISAMRRRLGARNRAHLVTLTLDYLRALSVDSVSPRGRSAAGRGRPAAQA